MVIVPSNRSYFDFTAVGSGDRLHTLFHGFESTFRNAQHLGLHIEGEFITEAECIESIPPIFPNVCQVDSRNKISCGCVVDLRVSKGCFILWTLIQGLERVHAGAMFYKAIVKGRRSLQAAPSAAVNTPIFSRVFVERRISLWQSTPSWEVLTGPS